MYRLLGFPSGELGPAVISLIGAKSGDYYENTYPGSNSLLTDVHRSCRSLTCLSRLDSGRSHHVPYTGNPFTFAMAPYTTSDFVTAMVTLAGPLGPNMPLTEVTPTAFTMSDGVQTLRRTGTQSLGFRFATNARGEINFWLVEVDLFQSSIVTFMEGRLTLATAILDTQGKASGATETRLGCGARATPRRTRGLPYH